MFEIVFYKSKDGKSEIIDYLDYLKHKSKSDKRSRTLRNKILAYIAALSEKGSALGAPFVKHIDGDIWELRPLNNRMFLLLLEVKHICPFALLYQKKSKDTQKRIGNRQKKSARLDRKER